MPAFLASLSVLSLTACGDERPTVSELCLVDPVPIERALENAATGGPVVLPDGTSLSDCAERVVKDADLQRLGVVLTTAADHLVERVEERQDAAAARQLGWLVGATERGAARTNGLSLELARRVGLVAGRLELAPPLAAALAAGRADGKRAG